MLCAHWQKRDTDLAIGYVGRARGKFVASYIKYRAFNLAGVMQILRGSSFFLLFLGPVIRTCQCVVTHISLSVPNSTW